MEHSLGVYRLGLKPAALEDARELFLTASATLIEGAQQIVEDLTNPLLGFSFSLAPLLHLVTVCYCPVIKQILLPFPLQEESSYLTVSGKQV